MGDDLGERKWGEIGDGGKSGFECVPERGVTILKK